MESLKVRTQFRYYLRITSFKHVANTLTFRVKSGSWQFYTNPYRQKGKCSLLPLGAIGKFREEFWMGHKIGDWILKASHQSINQNDVLSGLP